MTSSKKPKPQYCWMIKYPITGGYDWSDAKGTKKECIKTFLEFWNDYNSWKEAYSKGYRCVKVELKEVK